MNHYATLELPVGASQADIKKAFRRLAHLHHPDKGGDAEKFKKINTAYQALRKTNTKAARIFVYGSPKTKTVVKKFQGETYIFTYHDKA